MRTSERRLVGVLAGLLAGCGGSPPAPVHSPTRTVTATDITIEGAPPPDAFADDVREHTDRVVGLAEACYAERRDAAPDLCGALRYRVYVSAARVIRVTLEETSANDEPLERCVKDALLAYELPSGTPRGGATARFVLHFTPPEGP